MWPIVTLKTQNRPNILSLGEMQIRVVYFDFWRLLKIGANLLCNTVIWWCMIPYEHWAEPHAFKRYISLLLTVISAFSRVYLDWYILQQQVSMSSPARTKRKVEDSGEDNTIHKKERHDEGACARSFTHYRPFPKPTFLVPDGQIETTRRLQFSR